mmetsp:Transcript_18930/g.45704  ORF Transcript_18930/g.45704 Transcript_18930/m.45704 type:complete len:244 (-) Transcript_18930:153-884(-)
MSSVTPTVPSTVSTGGGTNNGTANNQTNTNRNGRKGNNNNTNNSAGGAANSGGAPVPKEFKNDSTDLSVMYQKYFDCSTQQDQVRFVLTQENLAIYVAQQYKQFGSELKQLVLDPSKPLPGATKPTMPMIPDPSDSTKQVPKKLEDCDELEKIIYTEMAKDYVKQLKLLEADLQALYNFILSRCTERLRDRIKTHERYELVDQASDPASLLIIIREISHQVESNVKLARSIDDQISILYKTKQ